MAILPACQPPPETVAGAAASSGNGPSGGAGGTDVVEANQLTPSAPRRLRRLSNREYNNVVHDLLGDTTSPANAFLTDALATGYDNGPDDLIVQAEQVESFQLAAESLAQTAVTDQPKRLIGDCDPTGSADACADAFLDSFVPRAFRRPLTTTERARLHDLYDTGAADGGFWTGVELALEAVLQSPQFLYREELGDGSDHGRVRLTAYELATELAFMTVGSMPDDTLWAAVQSGQFATVDDYKREATRLLATPAARPNLRAFFHEWLGTNRLTAAVTVKDVNVYPAWNSGLIASMAGELDRLYDEAAFGDAGTLRGLFSTPTGFVDPGLGSLYGVAAPEAGFAAVDLDPTIRPGVLSRAGYLASHADSDSSGPIARGLFGLSALLCHAPLPRPATIPPPPSVADAKGAGETTRERFAQHAIDSQCRACHQYIDGIGFGFEAFDGIGSYRATENGKPIDASGEVIASGDVNVDGPFQGVPGLVERLLAGHTLSDCFARQMYRFAMGAAEAPTDQPLLDGLANGFSVDARMMDVILGVVASPAFAERVTVEPGS